MTEKGSPLFIKTFEAIVWILEHTKKYPKHQRFVLAKRIEEAALSFQDQIVWASKSKNTADALRNADYHLHRLKIYSRLSVKMKLLSIGQYEHLAKRLEELGRLLGGWMRSISSNRNASRR